MFDAIGSIVISLSRCCLPNDEGPAPLQIFFFRTALVTAPQRAICSCRINVYMLDRPRGSLKVRSHRPDQLSWTELMGRVRKIAEKSFCGIELSPIPYMSVCCLSVGRSVCPEKCIVAKRLNGSGCCLGWWVGLVKGWLYQMGWWSSKEKGLFPHYFGGGGVRVYFATNLVNKDEYSQLHCGP